MEPFGLFNLLKSLLPQTENQAQNQTQNPEEPSGNFAPPPSQISATQNTENSSPSPTETTSSSIPVSQQNAFLSFVNRHEERKRNIKKMETPK